MEPYHLKLKLRHSHTTVVFTLCALVFFLIIPNSMVLANSSEEKQLVESAKHTLENFMEDPRLTWFQNCLLYTSDAADE